MANSRFEPLSVSVDEARMERPKAFATAAGAVQQTPSLLAQNDRPAARTVLVSSRLPASVHIENGRIRVERSAGGVATGLNALHDPADGLWIGWPGVALAADDSAAPQVIAELEEAGCVPVFLAENEATGFYEELANGALWPLLHSFLDRVPVVINGWEAYRNANARFAQAVRDAYQPGDVIWVHDYQLALVPEMLRQMLPDATIGFFLHVPVPSPEVFRVFPWREEFLRGILGADLIGFHTDEYRSNFSGSVRELLRLGADESLDGFHSRGGKFGVFPMGIDPAAWESNLNDPAAARMAKSLKDEARGRKIVVGVDRLDYTKGIPHRLRALEILFADDMVDPSAVLVVQLLVPSRQGIAAYEDKRSEIEELAGRINGLYGGLGAAPLRTMFGTVSPAELAGLYSVADLMLVTPLRDGMNLVAKEFVATRTDEDGVLVLSEFAGAAKELSDAVLVNPYDTRGMAQAMDGALRMDASERQRRMASMRECVGRSTVRTWSESFLRELGPTPSNGPGAHGDPAARYHSQVLRRSGAKHSTGRHRS